MSSDQLENLENLDNLDIDIEDVEIDDAASNKSSPECVKGSDVWKYFTRDANFKENKKSKCNYCGITYTCTGGSTSNMKNHIKNKHSGRKPQETSIKDAFHVIPKVNIL
jgi:BED zinc finger